ncbi:hypothetical protein P9112_005182 [Eukaryota sp. TZLM1-RC]
MLSANSENVLKEISWGLQSNDLKFFIVPSHMKTVLFFLVTLVLSLAHPTLPGLDRYVSLLDAANQDGMLNLNIEEDYLIFKVSAKIAGSVCRLTDQELTSLLRDPMSVQDSSYYVNKNHVFKKVCNSDPCTVVEIEPLSAFSYLKLSYQNTDPKWAFDYNWNYDDSSQVAEEDFNFGRITLKDTYFRASSQLFLEFDFNFFSGVKKCEGRFVQGVEASIGVEAEGHFQRQFNHQFEPKEIAEFTISILLIPITIRLRLGVGFTADVDSQMNIGSTFTLSNDNAELTMGYNDYKGFYHDYSFGKMHTTFERNIDGQANVKVELNVTLSMDFFSNSIIFYGSLIPALDLTVATAICPEVLHWLVDFLLDVDLGMSDITIHLFSRDFNFNTATGRRFPLIEHNIINNCADKVPVDVVASTMDETAPEEFILQLELERTSGGEDISNYYYRYGRTSTALCGDPWRCSIDDFLFVRPNNQIVIEIWRRRRFWFDSYVGRIRTSFSEIGQRTFTGTGRRTTIFVSKTKEIMPNTFISTDVVASESQLFQLGKYPEPDEWSKKRFIWGGSIVPRMTSFTAPSIRSDSRELIYSESRGENLFQPTSRMVIISFTCTRQYSNLGIRFSSQNIDWNGIDQSSDSFTLYIRRPSSGTIQLYENRWFSNPTITSVWLSLPFGYRAGHIISETGSTSDSRCTLTVEVEYPPFFVELSNPDGWVNTYPVIFILSDDLSDAGCQNVIADGFYHIGSVPSGEFYHVTGRWYDVVDEDKVSTTSLLVQNPAIIISVVEQKTCLTRYTFSSIGDSFLAKRVAFIVNVPRLCTTYVEIPSGMKGSFTRLHGEFWHSDIEFEAPSETEKLVIENPQATNFEAVVIYECQSAECSGPIEQPTHEVVLSSGSPYLAVSPYQTDFSTKSSCDECRVEYERYTDEDVHIITDDDSFTLTQSGHFMSPQCQFRVQTNPSVEGFATFTSTCHFASGDEVTVPENGKANIDRSMVQLSDSNTGFVVFHKPCLYCNIEGSIYSGDHSVIFVKDFQSVDYYTVFSNGPAYTNKLLFKEWTPASIECETVGSIVECSLSSPNVYAPEIEDAEFQKTAIKLTRNGQNVAFIKARLETPSKLLIELSEAQRATIEVEFSSDTVLSNEKVKGTSHYTNSFPILVLLTAIVVVAILVSALLWLLRKDKTEADAAEMTNVTALPSVFDVIFDLQSLYPVVTGDAPNITAPNFAASFTDVDVDAEIAV